MKLATVFLEPPSSITNNGNSKSGSTIVSTLINTKIISIFGVTVLSYSLCQILRIIKPGHKTQMLIFHANYSLMSYIRFDIATGMIDGRKHISNIKRAFYL